MFHAAVVAAFEVDEGFGNIEFIGQKFDELFVGLPLCRRGVQGDDKSTVVEFGDDLSGFSVWFDVNGEEQK